MQTLKRSNGMLVTLAAGTLLSLGAGAEVTAVSEDAQLDTRSLSRVAAVTEDALDSRSYTVDWSGVIKLNTKKIVGTMITFR